MKPHTPVLPQARAKTVLILVDSAPVAEGRVAEAVRVAAGLAAVGTLRVELVLIGAAAVSLPEAALQWKDGDRVQEHLALLQASGGMWDASIPGGKGGSFADTPSALAARLTQADIVLRF